MSTVVNPPRIQVVEVGPRDGLQNEPESIDTAHKVAFINQLAAAGLTQIEATSFVHPQRIPQLADAQEVLSQVLSHPGVIFSGLVPNERGLERALISGIKRIAVFTAASETFTHKNINMSIEQSLQTFEPVVKKALAQGLTVRGYVSTCFVCPYEGDISPSKVIEVTQKLLDMGIDEVSLGDTIGAAVPLDVEKLLYPLLESVPPEAIALHFHDTYGTALANVYAGLQMGIHTFDSSAGGLGGCPYAPGASGNLATEDLVYFLNRMGYHTGVDLAQVAQASQLMESVLGRTLPSKQLQRLKTSCKV